MKYTKTLFAAFLLFFAQTAFSQEKVEIIMEKAQQQSKKENKNVMVIFHASWCGWCKKMDKKMSLSSTKDLFEKNYVIAHVDVLEKGEKEK